jgi:outer membrane protein TolC
MLPILVGCIASPTSSAAEPLTLAATERLALTEQPALDAGAAVIHAARERQLAADELPDPTLTFGLKDYPINGAPAFTVDEDDFTMFTLGVRQEFTRDAKRRLASERGAIEVRARELELDDLSRTIRRDAALAWLEVSLAEQALARTRALAAEARAFVDHFAIGVRTNRASQADFLRARAQASLADDRALAGERDVARSRAALARWIGAAADRPLPDTLPTFPEPPSLEPLLTTLGAHPHLDRYLALERLAKNDVAQAREAYKADLAVTLEYGHRVEYPDFVGVRFEMDLPLFTRNRQDRRLAARLADAGEIESRRADALRVHAADARIAWVDWHAARARVQEFDRAILPAATQRVAAARSAYASSAAGFADVLEAREAAVEAELDALEQRVELVRAAVRLRYFAE